MFVGQIIHAYGTRYKVTKVTDISNFMKTPFWIIETTEMLMKD